MPFLILLVYAIGFPLLAGWWLGKLKVKRRTVLIHLFMLALPLVMVGISLGLFDFSANRPRGFEGYDTVMAALFGVVAVVGQITTFVILSWLRGKESKQA